MSRLFIHLSSEPTWIYYPDQPVSDEPVTIVQDGNEFTDAGFGNFTGFYDWLRAAPGKVIGVRYVPLEQTRFLLKTVKTSPIIQVDPHGSLLIFFEGEREFLDALSDDQDFEEARILQSTTGDYGLLLGCSGLSEQEQTELCRLGR